MTALAGKVAIVTGGATLIGAAVAQDLSRAGACVAILDLDAGNGARVADSLGERAMFVALDITDDRAIEHAVS
ncbi:TPA: SDR family NAD(P)-dependent oxidoreductase, partial [Burkholderia contaminans]